MKETKTANKKRPWETSDIVREVPCKATSHSKRYVMGDGTEKEVFTFEPMHYYDEKKKQWCEIDNTLEEREDGYTASLGKYKAKVSRKDDNEAIEVKGEDGEGNISWEYLGTTDPRYNHARKPKKHRGGMRVHRADDVEGSNGNRVIYENVDGDVDIEYGLSASGVKENIIIKEKSKRYKYFFKLYVNGFKMQLSEDGKSVEFYKTSDEERKTPEFIMPAPFMYDATGEVCREVYYDFEAISDGDKEEYLFTVTANEDWINSESRIFPITVDPQLNKSYESNGIISFYSQKVYNDNYRDSSGNIIEISPEIMYHSISVSKYDAHETKAYITVNLGDTKIDVDNVSSAKLKIISMNEIPYFDTLLIDGKAVENEGRYVYIDVTEAFKGGKSEFVLSTNGIKDNYIFYTHSTTIYIEVTYELNALEEDVFHTITLVPGVDVKYNVFSSEAIPVFEDITDSKMGISIAHIGKAGAALSNCGNGFRLSIDEKLKKIGTTPTGEKYQYTDSLGYTHTFKERFYYFDDKNDRIEISADEAKQLTVDLNGTIWYNGRVASRELYTVDGLIATSRLEDINGIEWLDQRIDEEKQLEEQIKSYGDAINSYVVLDCANKKISDITINTETYKDHINKITENMRLLTHSEAISYLSLLNQKQSLNITFDKLVAQENALKMEINELKKAYSSLEEANNKKYCQGVELCYNCENSQVCSYYASGEFDSEKIPGFSSYPYAVNDNEYDKSAKAVIYNNYRTFSACQKEQDNIKGNISNNTSLECINRQIDYLDDISKKNCEMLKLYYKEYNNLNNQLNHLMLQLPVTYLISGETIKGYNEHGNLIVISGKNGNYCAIEREYCTPEGETRVAFISNQNSDRICFAYDGAKRLASITDSMGKRTSYEYDARGNIIKVSYSNNSYIEFERGENKLTANSHNGFACDLNYENGLLKSIIRKSSVSAISYDSVVNETKEISSIGVSVSDILITEDGYEKLMHKVVFEDETGKQKVYLTDSEKRYFYFEVIDGLVSYAEKVSYKAYSNIKKAVADSSYFNLLPVESFYDSTYYDESITELNAFNKPIRVTEPYYVGNPTSSPKGEKKAVYKYDENQNVVQIKTEIRKNIADAEADEVHIERFSYNNSGKIVRKESFIEGEEFKSGINIEEYVYDKNGVNTKSVTYNSLDSSSKFYVEHILDENGSVITSVDQTGRAKTVYEYDAFGNIISKILPNGSRYAYGRDASGNITAITHSTEDGEENTTQKTYRNGVVTEVKSGNNKTLYTYDEKRRITGVDLNDKPGYVSYVYSEDDEGNNVVAATLANCVEITSTTDKRGNVIKTTCEDKVIENEYNSENKITLSTETYDVTTDGETETVIDERTYEYDSDGNISAINTNRVNEVYCYDENGKCIVADFTVRDIMRSYYYEYKDASSDILNSITIDDIVVHPELDVNGRNIGKTVSSAGSKVAEEQIAYLKFGDRATLLPSTVRYGNNVNGKYVVRDSVKYRYDTMGNIVEVLENGRSVAKYEYDALGRLTREDSKHFAKTTLFSYDDNGNILAKYEYAFTSVVTDELNTVEPTRTVLYGYDEDSDRLLTVDDSLNDNVEIFEYDDIGNPTTYRGKSATWSHGREMTSFDGNTFAYDARGRRVSKNGITFTYDSNGKLIKQSNGLEFIYDHTGLLAVEFAGSRYFYRKNAQNDVIALLDNDGNIVVKYVYDAWGVCDTIVLDENAANIANLNPFRYRSYYFDTETNLYFLKTRYYDPEICRFITIDDLAYLDADSINGLNLYAYCTNNPISKYDPTGKFPWLLAAAVMLFTPIGGMVTQAAVSAVSYAGIAVASVFDSDIRNDMNAIGWNPLNNDASISANANKVSFYKGAPVFITNNLSGSFSCGFVLLNRNKNGKPMYYGKNVTLEDVLKHEYGHNIQLQNLGLGKYLIFIGIPSPLKNEDTTPWELSASILGNSQISFSHGDIKATPEQIADANRYFKNACSYNPKLLLDNLYTIIF